MQFSIKSDQGQKLRGVWTTLREAEGFAQNYSSNHVGNWNVIRGDLTFSTYSNGVKNLWNV